KLNEDFGGVLLNKSGQYLAIIADGMGGHQAGEIASKLTYETFRDLWVKQKNGMTAEQSEKWLLNSINKANEKIYEYANQNTECAGMGTTIVVAIGTDEFITIGHVGDSRGYLLNETGFKQLINKDRKSTRLNSSHVS